MSLADFFTAETPTLANGVADIVDADGDASKHKKYLLLLMLLSDFGKGATSELSRSVVDAITRSHADLLKRLPKRYRTQAIVSEDQYQSLGTRAIKSVLPDLQNVLDRIRGLGAALRSGGTA